MCGITGVFNLNGESFPLYHLKKMAKAIEHRGPDGEGFYVKDNIAIAVINTPSMPEITLSKLGKYSVKELSSLKL